ncbi:HNH endonuclease [Staphylococcus schleiferi subsp. coagulans]|uniref:HNH endonuclease n=1 Tax=Staphylococcus coagulans TaxID=74706 RepID=UPI0015FC0C50|nr:HNH endonuclease [Staphylococcus coagulans]MBA8759961.1 HNH endonuclease [Staphylococcus coagulans]MBA8768600.1 HNH endonuclease [Staphylococcus coagulans]
MKYWIIPCNVKAYDVVEAFNSLKTIDWKQSNNLKSAQNGDVVLIYLSAPYSCIKYICKINEVNKSQITIDDRAFVVKGDSYVEYSNHMELELISEIEDNLLTLKILKDHGMKGAVQGPRSLKDGLLAFVLSEIGSYLNPTSTAEDLLENIEYKEGKIIKQYGTKFERSSKLRQKAIEIHGVECKVCGFNFEKMYGSIGKDFIEIHHIKPMYSIREEIVVSPNIDLLPLCSNCHKMIHRKKNQPLTIEELKQQIDNHMK